MITIKKKETTIFDFNQKSVENKIAWSNRGVEKLIVAVGGPSNWESTEPLPSDAILVDLVSASSDDPEVASELWNPFLHYVDTLANPGLFASMRRIFYGIRVKLDISELPVKQRVENVLRKSKPLRIKVVKG